MTSFIRSFVILGWVCMTAAIAPIAQAQTATDNTEPSAILNSPAVEESETQTVQSEEPTVIVAEIEGESSEVSAESSSTIRSRMPLTSRIFPCPSMQQ